MRISWYGADSIVTASDRHTSTVTSSTVDGADALHSAAITPAMLFCISKKHLSRIFLSISGVVLDGRRRRLRVSDGRRRRLRVSDGRRRRLRVSDCVLVGDVLALSVWLQDDGFHREYVQCSWCCRWCLLGLRTLRE